MGEKEPQATSTRGFLDESLRALLSLVSGNLDSSVDAMAPTRVDKVRTINEVVFPVN